MQRYASREESFKHDIEWMDCFIQHVRKVSITARLTSVLCRLRSHVALLLSGPNLQSVEMPNEPELLGAIKSAPGLEEQPFGF